MKAFKLQNSSSEYRGTWVDPEYANAWTSYRRRRLAVFCLFFVAILEIRFAFFVPGFFFALTFVALLLPGRLAGKLEVPSMRPGVFPGCILSQPFWRPMFPLRPSQVVRFRDRRNYFPTQVPLSLGPSRATKSFINVARANGKSRGDDVGNGSVNGDGSCSAFCDESCCLYSH